MSEALVVVETKPPIPERLTRTALYHIEIEAPIDGGRIVLHRRKTPLAQEESRNR